MPETTDWSSNRVPTGARLLVIRGSHAAGWRLIGGAIALLAGGDALGELLGLPMVWRLAVPAVLGVPTILVGLRWAMARRGRVHRTFLDALLIGVGLTLLAWQWVWQSFMGDHAVAAGGVITLGVAGGVMGSLRVFSRNGNRLGIERILLLASGAAYVIALMLVITAVVLPAAGFTTSDRQA